MPEQPLGLPNQAAADLARRLDEAWERRRPIPPLTDRGEVADAGQAYGVQKAWTELRLRRGEGILGRKIGLTSPAMQQQFGVAEPDFGTLWASRHFPAPGGRADVPAGLFLQPRIEGEIAFLLGRPLRGPGVTLQEVLAATEALAPALEIVDSRIEGWRIRLPDTIADNASYGGFVLGPWCRSLREQDLRLVGMLLHHSGRPAVEGIGAAALGHPARAVAWLANKLGEYGTGLEPGEIVLSGSLGRALPVARGDLFVLEMAGQAPLAVRFL
nr:MAG: 2-hydroxypenta-2,4-dienoate hydratase [Bacillota bacterium]